MKEIFKFSVETYQGRMGRTTEERKRRSWRTCQKGRREEEETGDDLVPYPLFLQICNKPTLHTCN